MASRVLRYWHTLRHLKPVQVYGRLRFRLLRPRPDRKPAPPVRTHPGAWVRCDRAASMSAPDRFRFLRVERRLASKEDWNRPEWPKLWLYHAHYFDDLMATDSAQRGEWHRALLERWVRENPPGHGTGWEPYPTSLRIVNWAKWVLAGNELGDATVHSLAVQARWLVRRLEFHLLGNHLWTNAKALVFAGCLFEGDEARAWRSQGLAILRRELAEQILPDGGQFERSPMYHALALEDLLDLLQLASMHPSSFDEAEVREWRRTAVRMLRWLRVMSHPDGSISLFNDAAIGAAPELAALTSYARALGLEPDESPLSDLEALPESGYVRLQAGDAVLIADVAPIGPDYLPGHAHADTLSFELSLGGRRMLVNGGTSTYETGAERTRQRGTAMHNTVEVDGADSSEVWASFRVARRAHPLEVRWGSDEGGPWLEAGHDGYLRLPGKVVHRRRWSLAKDGLCVLDRISGRFGEARANFRLAPDRGEPSSTGGQSLRWHATGESGVSVLPGKWHPGFGSEQDCCVLSISFKGECLQTDFRWDERR